MKNQYEGLRHFAVWQKKVQVILIGYSKKQNNVLIVDIAQLPEDERQQLIDIASNSNMQTRNEIASILINTRHTKSGDTWMANIASRLRRGDGSATLAFVKDLSEVHPSQMAYYKGYGGVSETVAPVQAAPQITEAEKLAVLGHDYAPAKSINPPENDLIGLGDSEDSYLGGQSAPVSGQTEAVLEGILKVLQRMSDRLDKVETKVKPSRRGRPRKGIVPSVPAESV